jgi:hypothetical protein
MSFLLPEHSFGMLYFEGMEEQTSFLFYAESALRFLQTAEF